RSTRPDRSGSPATRARRGAAGAEVEGPVTQNNRPAGRFFLDWCVLGELLFPSKCIGCARRGTLLCAACRAELPYLSGVCSRCALTLASGGCRGCQRLSPAVRSLRAVCAYEGAARAAVHAFKFRGGRQFAAVLGELLQEHLEQ